MEIIIDKYKISVANLITKIYLAIKTTSIFYNVTRYNNLK